MRFRDKKKSPIFKLCSSSCSKETYVQFILKISSSVRLIHKYVRLYVHNLGPDWSLVLSLDNIDELMIRILWFISLRFDFLHFKMMILLVNKFKSVWQQLARFQTWVAFYVRLEIKSLKGFHSFRLAYRLTFKYRFYCIFNARESSCFRGTLLFEVNNKKVVKYLVIEDEKEF